MSPTGELKYEYFSDYPFIYLPPLYPVQGWELEPIPAVIRQGQIHSHNQLITMAFKLRSIWSEQWIQFACC